MIAKTSRSMTSKAAVKRSVPAGSGNPSSQLNTAALERKLSLAQARVQNAVSLAFEKAVAHRADPANNPLPPSSRTVERAFHNFLETLPAGKRSRIIDRLKESLHTGPAARAERYGDLVNVNFRSPVPIADQIKALPVPAELRFNAAESEELTTRLHLKADKKSVKKRPAGGVAPIAGVLPEQDVVSTRVSFIVDSMTCLNPDDVRKDEINLAGFAVDSNGNESQLAPFFIGKFKKNDSVALGGTGKLFTLPLDPVIFPQSFTAGLFIVESDLISSQETIDKLTVLFIAVGVAIAVVAVALMVVSAFVAPVISVAAAYVLVMVSSAFQGIGLQFIPLLGDDISLPVADTLLIEDKVVIGESFARNLTIGKGFDPAGPFDGKYTVAARWLGEA